MGKEVRQKLVKVLEQVLEQLAFMFGEAVEKEELTSGFERYLHATMIFKGKASGTLGVAIPYEMGVVLTSNILGMEEGDKIVDERPVDAIREFINIVCGQFLTKVFGEGPVFDLTIPEVESLERGGWEELRTRQETIGMIIEELPLLAYISL